MRRNFSRCALGLVFPALLYVSALSSARAQSAQDRITQPINLQKVVKLQDRLHVLDTATDLGHLNANTKFDRMVLVLKPSAAQQQDLDNLVQLQQQKGSSSYHQWLTPQQFGDRFGVSQNDMNKVTTWLQSQGFHVDQVPNSRRWVIFSGTSGQVEQTFHTQMHSYSVNGEQHIANATVTSIPQALSPVVGGVLSLHDFFAKSSITPPKKHTPSFTGGNGVNLLAQADFATIYDVNPLYKAGINGAGQTIAIVGRSDVNPVDISGFRAIMGLPAANFQTINNGPDPGMTADVVEQTLDVSWSGAVAPGAMVDLVVSAPTAVTDGVDLSASYIVDNNLAPIMSTSYGQCEQFLYLNGIAYWSSIWEQAAAQGISAFVSAGDSGGAGCDNDNAESVAQLGFAVNGLASSAFNVAVGGTEFMDTANPGLYWSQNTNPANLSSALSYIPEMAWNESGTTATNDVGGPNIVAGGGGVSILTGKPYWQAGNGVPQDGQRDLPDVSLTAAIHDGYIICLQNLGSNCAVGANESFFSVGGTSASSPSFAGIMALINQKTNSIQGNPNPTIYALAGSANNATIFHDSTVGDNKVPAADGSLIGYPAAVGYDLATGWGSVDVNNMVNAWMQVGAGASTVSLTTSATTIAHGTPITLSSTVTPGSSGGATPSGDVSYLAASGSVNTSLGLGTLASGATSLQTSILPGGTQSITAYYAGDHNYASMKSTPISITVTPEASMVALAANGTGLSYGMPLPLTATVTGATSGLQTATGVVIFNDGGAKIGSGVLLGGIVPTNSSNNAIGYSNGSTSYTVPYLTAGAHSLTAAYAGDVSYNAATSTPAAITVGQAISLLSLESNYLSPLVNSAVTLTAKVVLGNGGNPSAPITGTVLFFDGTTNLGTAPLSGSAGAGGFYTATLPVTFTTAGAHLIQAAYNGDANVAGSVPSVITINVGTHSATRTALTANPLTALAGTPIALTAAITGDSATPAPTGTVTFHDGSLSLGTSAVTAGSATLSTAKLAAGSHNITASYAGDTNFTASVSAVTAVQVSDFTVATTSATASVAQGQTVQVPVTVTANGSVTSAVSLACSGLPTGATCSFAPVMVTPGTTSAQTVMLITTTGPTFSPALRKTTATRNDPGAASGFGIRLGGALLLGIPIFGFGFRRKRRALQMVLGVLGLAVLFGMAGCGGSSSSTPKYTATGGTATGTSTVTIKATDGTLSHTTTVTLTVKSVLPG